MPTNKLNNGDEIQVGERVYRVVNEQLCEVKVEPVHSTQQPVIWYPPAPVCPTYPIYPYSDHWYTTSDGLAIKEIDTSSQGVKAEITDDGKMKITSDNTSCGDLKIND